MSAPDASVEVPNLTSIVAARGDQIVAADANDSNILKRESAEDISRLQSKANTHSDLLSYIKGDFVLHTERLYQSKNNHTAQSFSTTNFEIVNRAALFPNASLSEDLEDIEFVGFDNEFPNNVPESFQARHISRAQSAINEFEISRAYRIGDLVLNDDIEYRCIKGVPNTTDPFDETDWVISDGMGIKNIKHIFSEDDFPATISTTSGGTLHPLEDGVEYIISAPVDLTNGLFVDAGFDIRMRSFSDHTNRLFTDQGIFMVFARDEIVDYTGVTNPGGGAIRFLTGDTSELTVGTHVNILTTGGTSDSYTQTAAEVTNIESNIAFTIASSVTFDTTNSTGTYDTGAKSFELENVVFQNPAGNAQLFSMGFTLASASEFYARHCQIRGFLGIGTLDHARSAIFNENEFEEVKSKIDFEDCIYALISSNVWTDTIDNSQPLLEIVGDDTQTYIVTNNQFISQASEFAMKISGFGSEIGVGRVIVEANVDLKSGSTSLFDPAGIDETDPAMIVKNNPNQKDSKIFADLNLPGDPNNTFDFPVGVAEDIVYYTTSSGWSAAVSQRLSVKDSDVGQVQYDGLEDTFLKIDYGSSMRTPSAGNHLFVVVLGNAPYQEEGTTLVGVVSGGSDATAEITSVDDGVIDGLSLSNGGAGNYDVSGEEVLITGNTSKAILGRAFATVNGSGVITSLALTDGIGFLPLSGSKVFSTVTDTTDFTSMSGSVIVAASTGDIFVHAFGNFTSGADVEATNVSTTYTEV